MNKSRYSHLNHEIVDVILQKAKDAKIAGKKLLWSVDTLEFLCMHPKANIRSKAITNLVVPDEFLRELSRDRSIKVQQLAIKELHLRETKIHKPRNITKNISKKVFKKSQSKGADVS